MLKTALFFAATIFLLAFSSPLSAQESPFSVKGYLDLYYKSNLTENKDRINPYFVSSNRYDAFQVNLAYLHFEYAAENYKFVFKPAFGTYMQSNYAAEPPLFQNILELYGSLKLSKKREIWLEAGVFGSPYTNESCVSRMHLTYTRSFAPEYVPYYLSGLRLKLPLEKRLNFYLMLLNGYQIIQNEQSKIGIGTHLEFNPNEKLNLNFTSYIGSTETTFSPQNRGRVLTDFNLNYNFEGDVSIAFCAYYGWQARLKTLQNEETETVNWGQVNLQIRQKFKKIHSVSVRAEYFYDPNSVQITPIANANGFKAGSFTLGYNAEIGKNTLLRLENRYFFAEDEIFRSGDKKFSKSLNELTANLTFRF